MAKVREEGFSKDADKLVRRLSLVALLLARNGHPAGAAEIRDKVEGYPLMTDDAFKRRFYEDRAELAALGIAIAAEPDADGAGELYSLSASAYYLPPVELDHDELAALAACLAVLEDHFAYSQPLRLALLSLAQGRPELVTEAATPALAVLPEEDEGEALAALPKLQAAIADRKTVRFDYYAIGRDQVMTRTVDPYGLQLVAGEWYLLGWCHLRLALRTFKLSRIRSRVTHATRAPHDFAPPPDFDLAAYRDRAAWQLGAAQSTAQVWVAPSMAWWVEAHYAHCGSIERLADGAVLFRTPYANARPLIAWALGLAEAAEVQAPPELRDEVALHLRRLHDLLRTPAPAAALCGDGAPPAAPPAARARSRRAGGDWHVTVDRFTRLTALTTYLLHSCGAADQATLKVADICAALDVDRETLLGDVRLLNLVNFGADGALLYAETKGRDRLQVYLRPRGPGLHAPGAPLAAAGGHAAAGRGAGRRPAPHDHRGGAEPRRAQAARGTAGRRPHRGRRRPAAAQRRRAGRRQHGHQGAPAPGHRVLARGHGARHRARGGALPAAAQQGRVVLRVLVPPGRGHARVPRGHHQAGAAAG